MRMYFFSVIVSAGLASALAACGGSGASDAASTPPDAGSASPDSGETTTPPVRDAGTTVPPVDNGGPSTTYPAFKPDVPQLQNQGGDTLKAAHIVTVTWAGDSNADYYEKFGDGLGDTDYWAAVTAEYGVGAAKSAAADHVRMQTPLAATINTAQLDAFVATNATGGAGADPSKWPAATKDTVYILYLPTTSALTVEGQGEACSIGVGGYHAATETGKIAYAIVPQCTQAGAQLKDYTTFSASHELAEAALDTRPDPNGSGFGWYGVDDAHSSWAIYMNNQVENGDLCEVYQDSIFQSTGDRSGTFNYFVQRQWSNKSILAGHSPCVPAAGVYFNTTLIKPEAITVDLSKAPYYGSARTAATGVQIAVGQTKTFEVGFYSDAKTTPWTLSTTETDAFGTAAKNLTVTLDKTSGQNGEKANVTVTVNKLGPNKAELLVLKSKQGQASRVMPILIGSP